MTTSQEKRIPFWGYLIVGLLGITVGTFGFFRQKHVKDEAQAREEKASKGAWVRAAKVVAAAETKTLRVLSESRPFAEAILYAKVSGYLKSVLVDKGDIVHENQILATIESPETEQAYVGARADFINKKKIATRSRSLERQDLISPQEAEQAIANEEIAQATLRTQETLRNYETLRAPFAGTVTSRYADPGALIQNATNSQSSSLPVVTVSQTNRLRIFSFVDQLDAPYIKDGLPVTIELDGRPDLNLTGVVARVAGELDAKTKMLLVEVDYDNAKGLIVPGSFVTVVIRLQTPASFIVPAETVTPKDGVDLVALITADQKIHFQEVKVADNDGIQARVLSGVKNGDLVALGLGDNIKEGDSVQVNMPVPPRAAPKASAAPMAAQPTESK